MEDKHKFDYNKFGSLTGINLINFCAREETIASVDEEFLGYFKNNCELLDDIHKEYALFLFERANLRKPADEDINYNLQIARTLVVDRLDEIPELFFVKWYNFMSLLLSSNSWAGISLTTFVMCLVFLSVYFYTSKYKLKVAGFWLAVTMLVISFASLAFTLRNKNLLYESNKAIIFSPVVNGKSSPDNSGTDLFVIHEGLKVTVEDEVGDWREIRLPDGNKGWVPANSLEII